MKRSATLLLALLLALHSLSQEQDRAELIKKLQQHVTLLASDSLEGRGLGTEGKLIAKNYIAGEFFDIGLQPLFAGGFFQDIKLKIGQAWVPAINVAGYLKGSDPGLKDEFIVIGAHYDHLGYTMKDSEKVIYHGADDNASGVAAVIELARYFAANPQLVKRSIIFIAFDAEESGLLGSEKFLDDDTLFDASTCRAMFSIDMVGMLAANKGLEMKGIGALKDGESMAKSLASVQGIHLKNTSGDIEYGTDTAPFAEKGIPATHIFTGLKSPYHKPGDTSEKLDYEGMAKVVIFTQSLITEMNADQELVPSRHFLRMQKPYAVRFNAGVTIGLGGSGHKYPGEYYNAKSVFAYNSGLFAQMNIGKRITFQPGVLFESDGSKSDAGIFRRQSVCIPADIHVNIVNEYGGMFKLYPFAGAYFRYSFDGKNGKNKIDFENEIFNKEWGFNLGLGADMKQFQVKLSWRRGLSELSRDNSFNINSSAWYFSFGYKL
jgi:aminopeptidase YwaD